MRIAEVENYTENFGIQRNKFDKTQLGNEIDGLNLSRRRFFAATHWDLLSYVNGLLNSSVVVRKCFLIEIGGASEDLDLLRFEDFDTWLRISKLTDKFKRIPHTLGYYWLGGNNITSKDKYIHIIQVIKKLYALEFQALAQHYNFYWINFAMGRYFFKRRNYNLAATSLELIGLRQSPLLVFFKS